MKYKFSAQPNPAKKTNNLDGYVDSNSIIGFTIIKNFNGY